VTDYLPYDCRAAEQADRYPDNSLDMGTGYDCFDELSHTDNPSIALPARQNRDLLRDIMQAAGFANYDKEWWHYTLVDETWPDTYFNFAIR
jgi:D-alanyl-D-alanine dipeptidase